MGKEGLVLFLLVLFLLPIISSGSVDDEMQKLTHYAQEYEIGNIDYVRLMLYMSAVRESLNEVLGVTDKHHGGIVKQEQIENILGEPNEETKWVWVEGKEQDIRLDDYVPIWRKIVFDGRKIQIRMEAYPSVVMKKDFWEDFENKDFKDDEERQRYKRKMFEEFHDREFTIDDVVYRLHFGIEFKKPEEQLDIQGKIDEIQSLAEIFNADSSQSNAEELAQECVNAERMFENYFKQNQGQCEDLMKTIFGSENQRESQEILLNEIVFFEGDDFEANIRLEMCDNCEWNWINFDIWIDSRGAFKKDDEMKPDEHESQQRFEGMDETGFRSETIEIINEIKRFLQERDFGPAINYAHRLRMLTQEWNERANNVWDEVEGNKEDMIQKEAEQKDPYYWIKQEQENRRKVEELRQRNYEERKTFYLDLFSEYEKREYYFTQTDFEKRLIQEFKERGEEICNNNQDDNDNGETDCEDAQCGGSICGRGITTIVEGNKIREEEVDFYCISGICKAKEKEKKKEAICGNNICEEGEAICSSSIVDCNEDNSECVSTTDCGRFYCPDDCVKCPAHKAIECEGKVVSQGEDEKGCALPPVCIEDEACQEDIDCPQPLCGSAECVDGECKMKELKLCNEKECVEGDKQIMECPSGEEIVTAICVNNMWAHMDNVVCPTKPEENCDGYCMDYASTMMPACPGYMKVSGNHPNCKCDWICEEKKEECVTAGDCGGGDDVCSNGKCVAIPKIVQEEPEIIFELPEFPEVENEEEKEGKGIFGFFQALIVGFVTDNETDEEETCPQIPISRWCDDCNIEERGNDCLCPMKKDENGCSIWDCDACTKEFDCPDIGLPPEVDDNCYAEVYRDENGCKYYGEIQCDEGETCGDRGGREVQVEEGCQEGEKDIKTYDVCKSCTCCVSGNWGGDCPGVEPPGEVNEGCFVETYYDENGCMFYGETKCGKEHGDEDWNDEERERHEEEQRENCQRECTRPCVEKCIRESCGEEMDCNIDQEITSCEGGCSAEDSCVEKCMGGGDWWREFEEEHKEEKGVFQAGGGCRTSQGRTDGFIWFGGWGDPFEQIEDLKHKYYGGKNSDWCKHDLENLIRQRLEFERGFNQEFAQWFFENYLANSAENWEQLQSGIYELYWSNVMNQEEIGRRMQCLGVNDITELMDVNLIDIKYETEFGKLEYWEEIRTVDMHGGPNDPQGKVTIISPYMKIWVFPSKEFLKAELKEAMINHEFPGPPEEKMERENQEGLTEEEKERIRQDKGFMKKLNKLTKKYGGEVDSVIQFKEGDEIVFNLYVELSEEDIIEIEPMLPEEVPEEDVRLEIEFEKLYDIIHISEKDMRGARIESPPWDRKFSPMDKVKEVVGGVKMFFKVMSMINSARVYPEEAKGEARSLTNTFIMMMMKSKGGGPGLGEDDFEGEDKGEEKDVWESKETITGEVIG